MPENRDQTTQLTKKKLELEVAELERPWWSKTFSWGTVLGLFTLFAVWASGVFDVKRERLAIDTLRLEMRSEALDASIAAKDEEVKRLQRNIDEEKAFRRALVFISEMGGAVRVSAAEDGLSYAVSVPQASEVLTRTASGDGYFTLFTEPFASVFPAKYRNGLAECLDEMANVYSLSLTLESVTEDELLQLIKSCPLLDGISIEIYVPTEEKNGGQAIGVSGKIFDELRQLRSLRSIRVVAANVTREQIRLLTELPKLEILSLPSATGLSDEVVAVLENCPWLRELDVGYSDANEAACMELARKIGLDLVRVPQGSIKNGHGELVREYPIPEDKN